jgi:hypothetical protein
MPPLNPVPGICQINVHVTTPAGSAVNVLHVGSPSNASSWIVGDINEACHVINTAYTAWAFSWMSHNCVGFGVTGVDLTSVTGVEGNYETSVAGGDTSGDLPLSAAAVISWQSARHYRGGHPRTYLMGLTNDAIANSHQLAASYAAGASTLAAAIISNLNGGSYTRTGTVGLVAVHRISHGAVLAEPLVDTITAGVIHTRIDTQRRRLGKE